MLGYLTGKICRVCLQKASQFWAKNVFQFWAYSRLILDQNLHSEFWLLKWLKLSNFITVVLWVIEMQSTVLLFNDLVSALNLMQWWLYLAPSIQKAFLKSNILDQNWDLLLQDKQISCKSIPRQSRTLSRPNRTLQRPTMSLCQTDQSDWCKSSLCLLS